MNPEERARQQIDRLLTAAGWVIQDVKADDILAARGVAIREFQLNPSAPIKVPDLATQRRIVAEVDRRLSIVRTVGAEVDANLNRAQALRQAALTSIFSEGLGS
jgi:hypothetical protein